MSESDEIDALLGDEEELPPDPAVAADVQKAVERVAGTKGPKRKPGPNDKMLAEGVAFPVDPMGMPLALYEIPDNERHWFWNAEAQRFRPTERMAGHEIALVPVQAEEHIHLFDGTRWDGRNRSFYVRASDGTIGLVPFPNSQVVWPHELAWTQDLHFARNKRLARIEQELLKRMKK